MRPGPDLPDDTPAGYAGSSWEGIFLDSAVEPLKGGPVQKLASVLLLSVLAGCESTAPHDYSVCSTQPGTYACQIEQYQNVDD